MEIFDYLRIARRRLWVLVGVPLLAAALALAYVLANPRPAVATVYVSAPSLMGSQYGTYQAQGASQFASNFVATASSPAVRDAVATETDVSVGDLEDGLSLEQVNLSSVVTITYTTRDSSTAGPVAAAVARQTLTRMFGAQVPTAQAAVDSAKDAVHDANTALAAFAREHGTLPADQQYQTLTAQIEQANLLAQQEAAAGTLTTSEQVLAQAQAQLAAADPNQVQAPPAQKISLPRLIVTIVLPAAAVGVFLAIALVALLELIAQRGTDTVRERLLVSRRSPAKPPAKGLVRRPMSREDLKAAE